MPDELVGPVLAAIKREQHRLAGYQASLAPRLGLSIDVNDQPAPVLRGRQALFARDLLRIGPWTTRAALKAAHRRNVLREGKHWDWLGGVRVYYPERIFRALGKPLIEEHHSSSDGSKAEEVEERLRRVIAQRASREASS